MKLLPKAHKEFELECVKQFPREACGFIIDDEFVPVPNSAEEPTQTFRIDPVHQVKASAMGAIQAVLHSHPYNKFNMPKWPVEWPTTPDMASWMKGNIPWGISATCGEGISQPVWLDESYIAPLEGREFIHGINDCYSLIRDWYRINKQVVLPNFARGTEWWYAGKNLYDDHFEEAGFYTIPLEQAEIGDVILMQAASPVTNHGAIVVGPNQILHHLFNRLSGVDSLKKWDRCIVRAIRYKGQQ